MTIFRDSPAIDNVAGSSTITFNEGDTVCLGVTIKVRTCWIEIEDDHKPVGMGRMFIENTNNLISRRSDNSMRLALWRIRTRCENILYMTSHGTIEMEMEVCIHNGNNYGFRYSLNPETIGCHKSECIILKCVGGCLVDRLPMLIFAWNEHAMPHRVKVDALWTFDALT